MHANVSLSKNLFDCHTLTNIQRNSELSCLKDVEIVEPSNSGSIVFRVAYTPEMLKNG